MSCPNFEPMEYGMPLVCGGLSDDTDYCAYKEAVDIAKKFTEGLTFHKVTVRRGYYYAFRFVVDEIYSYIFDLKKDTGYCISNEEAHEYFGMCRSEALRKADAEKRKIRKWLDSFENKEGYEILVKIAQFSNGEAVYEKRNNQRARLKSALSA